MNHPRTKIRKVIIDTLMNQTRAEDRVYDSRIYNLDKYGLPGIIIFSDHEDIIYETISFPKTQSRNLRITIESYEKHIDNIASKIDDLTAHIEKLIINSKALADLTKSCKLESVDINYNGEGEKPVVIASLIFLVNYMVKENNIEVII